MKENKIAIVMQKTFVGGFYRSHSGLLLFGFSMLASYCFLINTLGTVRPEVIDFWQFFFALNISSNPILAIIYCLVCLGYAFKAYGYVEGQLALEKHFFVLQSLPSLVRSGQVTTWLRVYTWLILPVGIFALYMVIIGCVFGNYLAPVLLLLFVVLLTLGCALITSRLCRRPQENYFLTPFTKFFNKPKPLPLLYLFQVIYGSKVSLVVSKLLSCLLLYAVPLIVSAEDADSRILLFTGAIVVIAHLILIYQERTFNDRYLSFTLNFPISMRIRFLGPLAGYLILLLPEILGMLINFPLLSALGLLVFILSLVALFRSLVLLPGLGTKAFLVLIFSLFFLYYVIIMCRLGWYTIPFSIVVSVVVFRRFYLNRTMEK